MDNNKNILSDDQLTDVNGGTSPVKLPTPIIKKKTATFMANTRNTTPTCEDGNEDDDITLQ